MRSGGTQIMSYLHLTIAEREEVRVMLEQGKSQRFIACKLERSPSTISRELQRNQSTNHPYRAHLAQERYEHARKLCRPTKKVLEPSILIKIINGLEQYWSPEQIIGKNQLKISIPTIYRALKEGLLPQVLISKLRRQGRKSHGSNERRGKFSDSTSIEERPEIVTKRERIGDWEGDTMCGAHGGGNLLTLVDRATSYLVASKMENRLASTLLDTITKVLSGNPRHTITLDNGKEFAYFKDLEKNLQTKTYFAHPRSPWERPINEHTNGLLRQFFPKHTSLKDVTEEDVHWAVNLLNNRPRKRLNWKTPIELFAATCCT